MKGYDNNQQSPWDSRMTPRTLKKIQIHQLKKNFRRILPWYMHFKKATHVIYYMLKNGRNMRL